MFGRAGRRKDRELLSDEEWYLIDTLIQDATVLNRRLGSEQRNAQANRRLEENCENERVVEEIKRLADKLPT